MPVVDKETSSVGTASGSTSTSYRKKTFSTNWLSIPVDLLVAAISPWIAATFDGFSITLNAIRGLLGKQKAAVYVAEKIAPVVINGLINPILTLIRTVCVRIFNSVSFNLASTAISLWLNGLIYEIKFMKKYDIRSEFLKEITYFITMFFSIGSFIAGIFDFFTDGVFDGKFTI